MLMFVQKKQDYWPIECNFALHRQKNQTLYFAEFDYKSWKYSAYSMVVNKSFHFFFETIETRVFLAELINLRDNANNNMV